MHRRGYFGVPPLHYGAGVTPDDRFPGPLTALISASGQAMRVDEAANGTEVRVEVGEALEVVLAEGRSTGYRWNVASDGAPVCRLERDRFEAPSETPGAPGRHSWTLTAVQAGAADVEFAYARPFGSAAPVRRFTLRVVAE